MSNVLCHICGGLVDRIGLQPRDARLCGCLAKIEALRKKRDALLDWKRRASDAATPLAVMAAAGSGEHMQMIRAALKAGLAFHALLTEAQP